MFRFRAAALFLGVSLLAAQAQAQSAPSEHAPPPRPALWGGLFALGAGYGVGVGLALKHSDEAHISWLWLPLAGPWITLGARSEADNGCAAPTRPADEGCKDASLDWALVFDGAVQTLGAGLVVTSFALGDSQVGVGFNHSGPIALGSF